MTYDLSKFEELVEQGYLRKSEDKELVLYGYTDLCTFERYWNEYTLMARGLILEKATGNVVAKPFPKFFNLGEREETFLTNLPNEPYRVFEKVDGSLGILFNYKGQWRVATRGSLHSEQAVKAQELLQQYDMSGVPTSMTLLVEIIYPENKIIVDYGTEEKLVLLGAYERTSGQEDKLAKTYSLLTGLPFAEEYTYTIEQMIDLQKTLPKDKEGFVVRFENGLRVKIKGEEYLKIAKIISQMSPISFWESMENGIVNTAYLQQIPEEFRPEYEQIVLSLQNHYSFIYKEILNDIKSLPTQLGDNDSRRTIGLFIKNNPAIIKHTSAIFPFVMDNKKALDGYIMKVIRPTGNVLIQK